MKEQKLVDFRTGGKPFKWGSGGKPHYASTVTRISSDMIRLPDGRFIHPTATDERGGFVMDLRDRCDA